MGEEESRAAVCDTADAHKPQPEPCCPALLMLVTTLEGWLTIRSLFQPPPQPPKPKPQTPAGWNASCQHLVFLLRVAPRYISNKPQCSFYSPASSINKAAARGYGGCAALAKWSWMLAREKEEAIAVFGFIFSFLLLQSHNWPASGDGISSRIIYCCSVMFVN